MGLVAEVTQPVSRNFEYNNEKRRLTGGNTGCTPVFKFEEMVDGMPSLRVSSSGGWDLREGKAKKNLYKPTGKKMNRHAVHPSSPRSSLVL